MEPLLSSTLCDTSHRVRSAAANNKDFSHWESVHPLDHCNCCILHIVHMRIQQSKHRIFVFFLLFFFCSLLFMEAAHLFLKRQIAYVTGFFSTGQPQSIFEGWPGVCCIFMCPNNGVAADSWDFQRVHRCQCMWFHTRAVQTLYQSAESRLWQKIPLPHWGVKPVSAACQTWHSTKWATFLPFFHY